MKRARFPVWKILAEVTSIIWDGVTQWRTAKAPTSPGGVEVTAAECEEMGSNLGGRVARVVCEALKAANGVKDDGLDLEEAAQAN